MSTTRKRDVCDVASAATSPALGPASGNVEQPHNAMTRASTQPERRIIKKNSQVSNSRIATKAF
jgi:hypothetical protein